MCLIVAKPKGQELPKGKDLRRWFDSYPDGFGVAFQYRGRVRILKGAMHVKEMFALLDGMRRLLGSVSPVDIDIVMQYREAVTGSVCPKYCHPFPVSPKQEDLDGLDVVTDCALAHNGVIAEYNCLYNLRLDWEASQIADINDAQEFIKEYLVPMGISLANKVVQKLIAHYTRSKFALLTPKEIIYIGDFIEDKGRLFSNMGYLPVKKSLPTCRSVTPYSELPYEKEFYGGGIVCEKCYQPALAVYEEPFDRLVEEGYSLGRLLCVLCFESVMGREPADDERRYC